MLRQERGGIRSRAEEDGVAQRDLAAVPGEKVPGLGQHRVKEDADHDVARVGLGHDLREDDEKDQDRGGGRPAEPAPHQKRPKSPCGRHSTTTR